MSANVSKSLRSLRLCFFFAALAIFAIPASRARGGTVYDAVKDFSASANPNGVWSYGWSAQLGGPLNLYTVTDSTSVPGISGWLESGTLPYSPPVLAHNKTTHTIRVVPNLTVPPNLLWMHPGSSGEYSVLQWTAPSSGVFAIAAVFSGIEAGGLNGTNPTSSDVHIFVQRGKTRSTTYLLGSQIFYSYDLPLIWPPEHPLDSFLAAGPIQNLEAGDTVSFAVGFGVDFNYDSDSTGVAARITEYQP